MTQEEFEGKVKEVVDEVRPNLQMDGGDVEFVSADLETGKVALRLVGACHGCPSASYTLKLGIERYLQRKIPEVQEVLDARHA
ncbi:MAG: NifU family protein [Myxococcota bacterium]|jgi:Fe-S cluster biogenesis protein NfuA|nr:NifU family protein [Myxococcota bacterium]